MGGADLGHRTEERSFVAVASRRMAELKRQGFDIESSASRQHYIDTGRYLVVEEVEGERALEAWRELYHDIEAETLSAADIADLVYEHLKGLGLVVTP